MHDDFNKCGHLRLHACSVVKTLVISKAGTRSHGRYLNSLVFFSIPVQNTFLATLPNTILHKPRPAPSSKAMLLSNLQNQGEVIFYGFFCKNRKTKTTTTKIGYSEACLKRKNGIVTALYLSSLWIKKSESKRAPLQTWLQKKIKTKECEKYNVQLQKFEQLLKCKGYLS